MYGQNPGVTCLIYLALNLWVLGYPDQAQMRCAEAISLSEEIAHPYSQSFAQCMAALFHALKGDPEAALQHSEQTIKISKQAGFPFLMAFGLVIRGWGRSFSGRTSMAVKLIRNGLEVMQEIGAQLGYPFFLSLFAEAYGNAGQSEEGLKIINAAQQLASDNDEHWNESDLHLKKGYLLEMQGWPEAETISAYHQAVDIARKQNAKSFELRGLMGLIRYRDRHGHAGENREDLERVYQWFKEGLDSDSLVEARGLLKEKS